MPSTLINYDEIQKLVTSLTGWSPDLDDDPNWLRDPTDFGFLRPVATKEDSRALSELTIAASELDFENVVYPTEEIPPDAVLYSGQAYIRLDALWHYMQTSELFDIDGWYGNDKPVVARWKDGYMVFDGNHRALAAKLMGRRCSVVVVQ